jgi:hypothetical protein
MIQLKNVEPSYQTGVTEADPMMALRCEQEEE